MTTTLQIHQTAQRVKRAHGYLELLEQCKERYREAKRAESYWTQHSKEDYFNNECRYRNLAANIANTYRYLIDRYNNTVVESMIIAPHMITTEQITQP